MRALKTGWNNPERENKGFLLLDSAPAEILAMLVTSRDLSEIHELCRHQQLVCCP